MPGYVKHQISMSEALCDGWYTLAKGFEIPFNQGIFLVCYAEDYLIYDFLLFQAVLASLSYCLCLFKCQNVKINF